MDPGIVAAIAMLLVWGIITFGVGDAPGATHLLLTLGLTLLLWRIAKRNERK
jgi:hypothetical protein